MLLLYAGDIAYLAPIFQDVKTVQLLRNLARPYTVWMKILVIHSATSNDVASEYEV